MRERQYLFIIALTTEYGSAAAVTCSLEVSSITIDL